MEKSIEEGATHTYLTVIGDVAQLAELTREKTRPGARSADHFGGCFLTETRDDRLRLPLFSK